MKNPSSAFLALALLAFTGCSGVFVSRPVGDQPHALTPEKWDGIWSNDHDVVKFHVIDATKGQLQIVETKEREGKFIVETNTAFLRDAGGWTFANVVADSARPDTFGWARIEAHDDLILIWAPDVEKFSALVRAKKVRGVIDGDDVFLEPFSAAELKALIAGELGVPFKWDQPVVIRRVAN